MVKIRKINPQLFFLEVGSQKNLPVLQTNFPPPRVLSKGIVSFMLRGEPNNLVAKTFNIANVT